MLSRDQIETYRRDGFIVVPDVLSGTEIADLRAATDALVDKARLVTDHDDVYDLEPSHSPDEPRVRRIKTPHRHHEIYAAILRHDAILRILRQLVAPALRFDTSKLNMKAPGYGAAV